MTLPASAAPWPQAAKTFPAGPTLVIAGVAVGALLVALYLAGFAFLVLIKADPRAATLLTLPRYAHYYGEREDIRRRLWVSAGVGVALTLAPGVALLLPKRRSLHGDARFATRREIARAGLLGDDGIILGRLGRRCLMLPGQQGVALAAPPRAGKGTGVVIPNALNWPGSLVCVDIKKENWTITAGFRAEAGQAVYLFDPFAEDRRTARWNPLSYVSDTLALRVNGLQRIADMFYPEAPGVDPFWIASARTLFLGIALYVFETPSLPKTIGEILRLGMASGDEGFAQHWKRLIEGRRAGKFPLSPECVRALCDVIDLAPVTASSIRKTFTSRLDLWLNPILDWATAENDFDLRELRAKPMSIYVGVNPDDLHRLRPVLSLFFQQAIGLQTRTLPEHDPKLKLQVLMLLDECAALGRIPILAESLSYLPGYNVRVALVIHTAAQLRRPDRLRRQGLRRRQGDLGRARYDDRDGPVDLPAPEQSVQWPSAQGAERHDQRATPAASLAAGGSGVGRERCDRLLRRPAADTLQEAAVLQGHPLSGAAPPGPAVRSAQPPERAVVARRARLGRRVQALRVGNPRRHGGRLRADRRADARGPWGQGCPGRRPRERCPHDGRGIGCGGQRVSCVVQGFA